VWIVKAEHVGPPGIILAPTDFSDVSRKAILEALRLAEHANAELHLLHVIDSNDIQQEAPPAISHAALSRHEINEIASKRLIEFLNSFERDRRRIHSHLAFGTPWKEIHQMVQRHKVDLIAMGTVGRNGIKGIFLGSTAEKVLDTCDCSILTTKPDGFVSPVEPLH
jgi:nucleotide-binding universal stress UspA family protein